MNEPQDPPRPAATDPDAALADALQRSRVLRDAPESVIQRAIDVFVARPRAVAAPAPAGVLRRLVAVLGFDSGTLTPRAAGLRSAGASGTFDRQLLFSADGRDVDLRITLGTGGWRVSGQVLGPDAEGRVALTCGGFSAEQAWNDLAEFHFDGVPAGRCRIALRGDDWEMVLPEVLIPGEHTAD